MTVNSWKNCCLSTLNFFPFLPYRPLVMLTSVFNMFLQHHSPELHAFSRASSPQWNYWGQQGEPDFPITSWGINLLRLHSLKHTASAPALLHVVTPLAVMITWLSDVLLSLCAHLPDSSVCQLWGWALSNNTCLSSYWIRSTPAAFPSIHSLSGVPQIFRCQPYITTLRAEVTIQNMKIIAE